MMPKRFIFLLLTVLFMLSCDNDFQINAKWKDITIVYGLLNTNEADSVHYIRINRAYLNEDNDALMLAKISDSINYADSLFIKLETYNNGNYLTGQDIILHKVPNYTKDTGIFTNEDQYLYATDPLTVLNPKYIYKLVITNSLTGKKVVSSTAIVDNVISAFPKNNKEITFNPDNEITVRWFSGLNAYFYDLVVEIHYNEYKRSTPENKTKKVIYWPIVRSLKPKQLDNVEEMKINIAGSNFFEVLKDNILYDPSIDRELLRLDFIFSAGGEGIYNYINVNKPAIGTVQKKPEYTNIENGLGVFSSRNQNIITVRITHTTLLEIQSNEKTMNLNFVR